MHGVPTTPYPSFSATLKKTSEKDLWMLHNEAGRREMCRPLGGNENVNQTPAVSSLTRVIYLLGGSNVIRTVRQPHTARQPYIILVINQTSGEGVEFAEMDHKLQHFDKSLIIHFRNFYAYQKHIDTISILNITY